MSAPAKSEHLLPDTASPLEKALSASDVRTLALPTWIIRAAWDIDACPVHLLPYLAQAWSVDEWDPAWSDSAKRQAIRDSIWIHQHKGTIGALKRAIGQLGLGARVVRWFEQTPRARAYTFALYVRLDAVTDWTAELGRRLFRVAITNKAVRSHLDRIVIERPATVAPVKVGVAIAARVRVRLVPDPVSAIRSRANVNIAPVIIGRTRISVGPRPA